MGLLSWLFGMKKYSVSLASVHTIYARILNNAANAMSDFKKLEQTTTEIQKIQADIKAQEKKLKKQEKKNKIETKLLKNHLIPLNQQLTVFTRLFKQLSSELSEIILDTQKQLYIMQQTLKKIDIKTENQIHKAQISKILESLNSKVQEILDHIYKEHRQLHSGLLSTELLSDFTISSEIKQLREIKRAAIDSNNRYTDNITIANFTRVVKDLDQILTNLDLIATNAKVVLVAVEGNFHIAVNYAPNTLKGTFKRAYNHYKSKTKELEKESKRQLNEAA